MVAMGSTWRSASGAPWALANLYWLPVLLAAGVAGYMLRFLRWHVMVGKLAPELGWRTSLRIYMAGFALALTPGRLGELLKFSLLRSETGVAELEAVPVFPLERASEAASCLLLMALAASAGHLPHAHPSRGTWLIVAFLPMAALGGLYLRVISSSRTNSFSGHLGQSARRLLKGTAAIGQPGTLAAAMLCAMAARCFEALAFYAGLGVIGVMAAPGTVGLASGISGLVGGLSLLPGGISAVEASLVGTMTAYGVPLNSAVVAALISRAATLWLWIPGGLWLALSATPREEPPAHGTERATDGGHVRAPGPSATRL